jgi:hypothetical protein
MAASDACLADPPPAPQENFLSSLKQAFSQDFDHDVVRGHFDVGSPPDSHRYYCLVDPKTGKRPPNGVAGEPAVRADGMTGIKVSAVSLYSCASAEQQGLLVDAGYVSKSPAVRAVAPPAPPAPPAPTPAPPLPAVAAPPSGVPPDGIDIAGVHLGMSPDEVRSVLRSRMLRDFYESTAVLVRPEPAGGGVQPIPGGRFVNVLAAWTPAAGGSGAPDRDDSEFYEVMFTPVPGRERAMAIVHSAAYSASHGVRESTLENALAKKYGGSSGSVDWADGPTWRVQSGGAVQSGDACRRRGIVGGLGALKFGESAPLNLALTTPPEEFRYQIDHCGVAIITEEHVTRGRGASDGERLVSRFTVTAYGPSIGMEGAAAAGRLVQAAGNGTPPIADDPVPPL